MDAYLIYGKLLKDEPLRRKRLAIAKTGIAGPIDGIEAMSSVELQGLRERVTGVLPFTLRPSTADTIVVHTIAIDD
jgi:hypothetical protein